MNLENAIQKHPYRAYCEESDQEEGEVQLFPGGSDDDGEVSNYSEQVLQEAAGHFDGFEPENLNIKSFKARSAAVGLVAVGLYLKEILSKEKFSLVFALFSTSPGLFDINFISN